MTTTSLSAVVQKALGELTKDRTTAPTSLRALAARVGVSHQLLGLIVAGERTATPAVAEKVAQALEELGEELAIAAQQIRRAAALQTGSSPKRTRPRRSL